MKKSSSPLWSLLLILLVGLGACNPEKENPTPHEIEDVVKTAIFESMKDWYYWESELPATIDVTKYNSNQELLDDLIFQPLDRFSYLTTRAAFEASFTGQASGLHGFGYAVDENENLFVSYVFDEAPAGKDGWKRGWQVLQINEKPVSSYKLSGGGYNFQLGPNEVGVTNSFKFKLPDGTETSRTISKGQFQTNSVLHRNVISQGGKKIGHWVYQSFKATAGLSPTRSTEVEESFDYFQNQGINELIIDLRYNGGGSVAVTEQIINYIIPAAGGGKLMYTNKHNDKKSSNNRSVNFRKNGNLNLNRLIVITSRGSASASELLINNLEPYMDVILIGDRTFGKPVGSFPLSSFNRNLSNNDVELVPITFATANADGRADYFEGFPVDFEVGDNPSRNWDDLEETRTKSALEYIESGTVNARLKNQFYRPKWEMIDNFKGLEQEFPMF
jgi:C-terminal processing protease CtpA/Prc